MMRRATALLLFLMSAFSASSQEKIGDKVLTPERFNRILLENHPMAEKAALVDTSGSYEVKKARGQLDPILYSDWDTKNFEGKHYYQVAESGLKIPTWIGVDLKLYRKDNSGQYLNPENDAPGQGLYGIGVSLPLGEGLFTDQRRTAINKAKVIKRMNSNRREQLLIELLNKGFKTYWEWAGQQKRKEVLDQARRTARKRFENVKKSFSGGEKPAIDTTDALSQLQRWRVKRSEAIGSYRKKVQLLSVYLWNDADSTIQLRKETQAPDLLAFSMAVFDSLHQEALRLDSVPEGHPTLQQYRNKLEVLSIENRWRKEQIKPELDLEYHALQNGDLGNLGPARQVTQDLKWGVSFNFPLFLRKEINSLRLNRVKTRTTELELQTKEQRMDAELRGLQALLGQIHEQIRRNRENLANYQDLVQAEEARFEAGESDLFRINYREMTYLKARLDQISYITDFFKTYSEILYRFRRIKRRSANE